MDNETEQDDTGDDVDSVAQQIGALADTATTVHESGGGDTEAASDERGEAAEDEPDTVSTAPAAAANMPETMAAVAQRWSDAGHTSRDADGLQRYGAELAQDLASAGLAQLTATQAVRLDRIVQEGDLRDTQAVMEYLLTAAEAFLDGEYPAESALNELRSRFADLQREVAGALGAIQTQLGQQAEEQAANREEMASLRRALNLGQGG